MQLTFVIIGLALTCLNAYGDEGEVPNWISAFVETKLSESRKIEKIRPDVSSKFKLPLEFLEADPKSTEEKPIYVTTRVDSAEKLEGYVRKLARGAAASGDFIVTYKAPNTYEVGLGWLLQVDPKARKITRITSPSKGVERLPPIAQQFFTVLLEKDRKKRDEGLSKLLRFPMKLREVAYEPGGPGGCTTYFRDLDAKDLQSLQAPIASISETLEENDPSAMFGGGFGVTGTGDCYHRWGILLNNDRNTITHLIIDADDNVYGAHPQKKQFKKELTKDGNS